MVTMSSHQLLGGQLDGVMAIGRDFDPASSAFAHADQISDNIPEHALASLFDPISGRTIVHDAGSSTASTSTSPKPTAEQVPPTMRNTHEGQKKPSCKCSQKERGYV